MNEKQKEAVLINLAQNLPTLRAKANLSQAKLSEMIGISRQTLVSVENGKRLMSWNTFLACLLVFKNNPETNRLLEIYDISTEQLDSYLDLSPEKKG